VNWFLNTRDPVGETVKPRNINKEKCF
jgi:hypothetical protein